MSADKRHCVFLKDIFMVPAHNNNDADYSHNSFDQLTKRKGLDSNNDFRRFGTCDSTKIVAILNEVQLYNLTTDTP